MEIWLYYQEGASSKPADAIVISKDCLGPEWSKEQDLKSYSIDNGGVVDESGRVV